MSIASQLSALTTDRNAIRTALVNQGVTEASGHGFDDFAEDIASIVAGSGAAISIVETPDSHGGTVLTINGVELTGDTVTPEKLLSGYTAHNAAGDPIVGTLVPSGITPTGTLSITANGTYDVTQYASASVTVPATGTDTTDATLSSGAQMLAGVTAYAKAVKYTGTIPTKSSADLTANGSTITVPSGYYSVQATKSVTTTAFPTATAATATTGYSSLLTINRSTADQYINIQAGYKTSSGYYKISSVPNGAVTAPGTITGTSATVTTGTNTVTFSKAISVTPNVTTAGYISQGTAGNATVTLTANISTVAATTYNTSTADQTIAASRYLTGAQTIKSVITTNLSASNILSGVTIKVGDANDDDRIASVTGTVAFQTIYSGSGNPASGTGVNGDIYIKTA